MLHLVNILPLTVPEGWSDPANVDTLRALLVYAGYPALLFAAITLLVLLPRLAKGAADAASGPDHEWFGGPRKSGDELAGPDGDDSKAGGASARW
jgi:hypothetical protein